jgi:hypothetical protein
MKRLLVVVGFFEALIFVFQLSTAIVDHRLRARSISISI